MRQRLVVGLAALVMQARASPNILFIVVDDVGHNDVSYHGSQQVPTPNIDALAAAGVALENYYVQPVCSPSRSTFLSGRHVIHTGLYMPFAPGTNQSLAANYTLLPGYLKACCGYATHAIGKWHLGNQNVASLPTARGFDTHFGYWSGDESYYTHIPQAHTSAYDITMAAVNVSAPHGMSLTSQAIQVSSASPSHNRRLLHRPSPLCTRPQTNGTYSTYLYANAAVDIIGTHAAANRDRAARSLAAQPLFLYLAFQNVHWPLEAPAEYVQRFANTTGGNTARQLVCAMMAILDDAIGNVTAALKAAGMLEDTLIVFTSDNGGPENGDEGTESNNFPLRGGKNTLWQGGVRVDGIIAGAGVTQAPGTVLRERVHASDWLPSLVTIASGQPWTTFVPPTEGAGMDVSATLLHGTPSPREWVLLETHPAGEWAIRGSTMPGSIAPCPTVLVATRQSRHLAPW